MDEVEEWGVAALDACVEGVRCETLVHVCYGYGVDANVKGKTKLGEEWDQYAHIFPFLAQSKIGGVSLELAGLHVPPRVLGLLGEKKASMSASSTSPRNGLRRRKMLRRTSRARKHLPDERTCRVRPSADGPMRREDRLRETSGARRRAKIARGA